MTVRTTANAVNLIIEYDTALIPSLTSFILSASVLVDEIIAYDDTPTVASLELTERYLTSHLIAVTDPRLGSEQVKSLQQSFQYKLSLGLGVTHWGQLAMLFDTTGRLARWNARNVAGAGKVQFFWAGTEIT